MRSRDVDHTRVKDVVAVVLAGGKGTRLDPLTRDRAKPAVPFGGSYRIIDFALSKSHFKTICRKPNPIECSVSFDLLIYGKV